jgi:hypothetical protein
VAGLDSAHLEVRRVDEFTARGVKRSGAPSTLTDFGAEGAAASLRRKICCHRLACQPDESMRYA